MTHCKTEIQDEKGLPDDVGDLLQTYARVNIPGEFLNSVLNRFETATAVEFRKRAWMAFLASIGGVVIVVAPILWAIIFNFTFVSKMVVAAGKITALIFSSIWQMWLQLPELSFGILIVLWTTLFCCTVILLKTFQHVANRETTSP